MNRYITVSTNIMQPNRQAIEKKTYIDNYSNINTCVDINNTNIDTNIDIDIDIDNYINININNTNTNINSSSNIFLNQSSKLDIQSIFRTVQGEGPFSGQPAIFIRLAGCNLQCPACDTDYTSQRVLMTIQNIVERVSDLITGHTIRLIVITGGEPLRQDISQLCTMLYQANYTVQIETNGTFGLPKNLQILLNNTLNNTLNKEKIINKVPWFNIVCSPKTGKTHPSLNPYIVAWKYVLSAKSIATDGLPILILGHSASPQVARPNQGHQAPVYLQACDDKNDADNQLNQAACVQSCLKYGYTLQLQIHKYLNIE
jgi:7-carboxy-7-deazaguanine synthase